MQSWIKLDKGCYFLNGCMHFLFTFITIWCAIFVTTTTPLEACKVTWLGWVESSTPKKDSSFLKSKKICWILWRCSFESGEKNNVNAVIFTFIFKLVTYNVSSAKLVCGNLILNSSYGERGMVKGNKLYCLCLVLSW